MSPAAKLLNSLFKKTKTYRKMNQAIDSLRLEFNLRETQHILKLKDGVSVYIPNQMIDSVQGVIGRTRGYYEQDILEGLNPYVKEGACILDIGANIGNHTLYWSRYKKPARVVCFEPVQSTYAILEKNITLNHLEDRVKAYNFAVSDCAGQGSIQSFDEVNIGATKIQKDAQGDIQLCALDDVDELKNAKVDFIKIDVEGFELNVLKGAHTILERDKPVVFIEAFKQNYGEVRRIFESLGYKMVKKFPSGNYLFIAE